MRDLVVVDKGPTSFGAYVPDLPGRIAVGETREETRNDASFLPRFVEVTVKPFTTIAVIFLALIALLHRLFTGWQVTVVGLVSPVWWSAFGLAVAGGLAPMVWRQHASVDHDVG